MVLLAEYIWIGGENELRSKTKVLHNLDLCSHIKELPKWNYDGSSTKQATGTYSEIILKPVAYYSDPFRKGNHILVLCSTFRPDGTPLENNHRITAKKIFNKKLEEKPWFGIEQEFFIMDPRTDKPVGFPVLGNPNGQGQYYCSVGSSNAFCRFILDEHLLACLHSGLNISGINAEVAPGQWEYQIGPCTGIESGDQVCVSRYILKRIAEKYNLDISWHPKPVLGDWNGSGCHTNYSTVGTRSKNGLDVIYKHMEKLQLKHNEHMDVYGQHNNLRMTGEYESSNYNKFSYGVGNRGASVRIGNDVVKNKCGYYEDRRPASNMDPYLVTSKIFETTEL